MQRTFVLFSILLLVAGSVSARSAEQVKNLAPDQDYVDIVGDVDGAFAKPAIAVQGTIWVADWSFDVGGCDDTGWVRVDNFVTSNGLNHWAVTGGTGGDGNLSGLDFNGLGNIVGKSAIMGEHDLCFEDDGYANNWGTALRMDYTGGGANFLSFDYLVDTEGGFDFLQVETDSACASFDLVDYVVDPTSKANAFRTVEFFTSGFDTSAATTSVDSLPLTDYGPGPHCLYISFTSDGGWSPADGFQLSTLSVGCAVDNIVLAGNTTYSEDFEDGDLDAGTVNAQFLNIQDSEPFGEWIRLFSHITDNDACTENVTCAYLNTDYTTPTVANDPSMAFGPGQFVFRNWLDDTNISPWVSLATTPTASGTVMSLRYFPGNNFGTGRAVFSWEVRGKLKVENTDTPAPGDSVDCLTSWGHVLDYTGLSAFNWRTRIWDTESYFTPSAREIQFKFRSADWQDPTLGAATPPIPHIPGPGPYVDRIRVGRRVLTGPVINTGIDTRTQAQDAFATDPTSYSGIPNWKPSIDRFGTAAFSRGSEKTINASGPNIVFGDSIYVAVQDVRGAGGLVDIDWYGIIVSGPHAGLAPPPHSVGAGGFFKIAADSSRNSQGNVIANNWFVSLDDEYFRGGDVLRYAWFSTDAQGGPNSSPGGLVVPPTDVAAAELATGGLFEVNYLPVINWGSWDPSANAEPTQAELDAATQKNCILYSQYINGNRRSGDANRTSVMYTLDQLGYADLYDVYDPQGLGNTNNQMGSRATVQQATGYSLIIYDVGGNGNTGFNLPDGVDIDASKVDQAGWFQSYLGQATISEAQTASIWLIGDTGIVEERSTHPLITGEMGIVFVAGNQGLNNNPDIVGQTSMTFANGAVVNFAGDTYSAAGGCPGIDDYDALGAIGSAVITHAYKDPNGPTVGDGAIVMNADAANKWNTIMQSHAFFDIRDADTGPTSPSAEKVLMTKILSGVMPLGCEAGTPVDVGNENELDAPPIRTALYQNIPNPFNPMTTIKFDLARDGQVGLKIYDVAGRLVRSLVNDKMTAGRKSAVWNGLDDSGDRVSSGVYFYRLVSDDFTSTRKLVVLK